MTRRNVLLINTPVLAVDRFQVLLYAESIPFGLLQIAAYEMSRGCRVEFIDMMGYLDGRFEAVIHPTNRYGDKPAGCSQVSRLTRPVHLYGQSMATLRRRLARIDVPDEVLVSSCISFNWELTRDVIRVCREAFPGARILLGGFYPTAFPDHAVRCGADQIHQGRHHAAEAHPPSLELLSPRPPIWLFRLVLGCRHRCSFCLNANDGTEVIGNPAAVTREVLRVRASAGIRSFSCWDPNVMQELPTLTEFLSLMADAASDVRLKFEMGIQPDLLTPDVIDLMKRAGTSYMTIPFESSEPAMMKRFGKPYRMRDCMDAVARCRDQGFDTSRFHCTWVVGIPGEGYRHIFRTYFGVLKAGGLPTPFPITVSPGTREFDRHRDLVVGKDLDELNGHLWPLLSSARAVEEYEQIYQVINASTAQEAERLARDLGPEACVEFRRQLDWYAEGPHQSGDNVD